MKIKLSEILQDTKTVAISGHIRPDGDCVGSCIGLYLYIQQEFPDVQPTVYLEEIRDSFKFLEGSDRIIHSCEEEKVYDLFIALDAGDKQRLGASAKYFDTAKRTVCIDHHISNPGYAQTNYIEAKASSTCELIYDILDEDKIGKNIAEALYMGIAHDTGIFRYSCTSPETMEAAAQLMRKGVDTAKITDRTYYEKTYVQNQILGRALLESIMVLDQRCIVSVVRLKEMEFFQAKPSDLEGIVSQMRQTKGVEVAMFLHETAPQTFKVSLRSKERVDVSRIAKYFGGGGHVRAAGVTMKGSVHDVINNLTALIEKQLDEKIEQED